MTRPVTSLSAATASAGMNKNTIIIVDGQDVTEVGS